MRTSARTNNEEERVLHLAMQPDDAGEAAKYFALAAFFQDWRAIGPMCWRKVERRVHEATANPEGDCIRAIRSL